MTYTVKDILKIQVAPALGCTEPVAIALGAAAAVSLLPEKQIDEIEIWVDPNIYKNGLAVSIPGTGGLSGLDMASAVGALGGDAALKLEVLDSVDSPAISAAQKIVKAGRVKVNLLRDQVGLFIKTIVKGNGHTAESVITGLHDNIVSLALDGRTMTDHVLLPKAGSGDGKRRLADLEAWLKGLSLDQLIELLDDLDDEDLKFLESGVDVNMRLADYGLKHGPGLGVGRTMERLVRQGLMKRDMITAATDSGIVGRRRPHVRGQTAGHEQRRVGQPRPDGHPAHCRRRKIHNCRSSHHPGGHRSESYHYRLCESLHRAPVRHMRLLGSRRRRGHGRRHLPDGWHEAAHCRCHQEPYRRSGRGDLRRGQGRMRPETGHRCRNGSAGGTVRASGGQRQRYRRHHRPIV